jgi:hypothetical protein
MCVYTLQGEKYEVDPGALGFALVVWIAGFVAQTVVFYIRRRQGGELGGSKRTQGLLLAWSIVSMPL